MISGRICKRTRERLIRIAGVSSDVGRGLAIGAGGVENVTLGMIRRLQTEEKENCL